MTGRRAFAKDGGTLRRDPGAGVMPRTVSIGEAKARLSNLIARAEAGEDVVIARNGAPVARIVPLRRPVEDTITLLRKERERRPRATAAENRAAVEHGRA